MPKAKTSKRKSQAKGTTQATRSPVMKATAVAENESSMENRAAISRLQTVSARSVTSARGMQGLIMPAIVALGCWALAFSLAVFSSQPNHVLFAGMAVLMALIWTYSFSVRMRTFMRQKQR